MPQGRGNPCAPWVVTDGIAAMGMPWIFSSTLLPTGGLPVDFMLEDRDEPIHGTFDDGVFHSRWASYEPGRIQSWRHALDDPAHEAIDPIGGNPTGITARRSLIARLTGVAAHLVRKRHGVASGVAAQAQVRS